MIRVLHIIQGYGGGVSSIVKNLIINSDQASIKQDVMSFSFSDGEQFIEEIKKHGAEVFLMPRPRKDGIRTFTKYVVKVIEEGRYDVIHCHTDGWRAIIYHHLAKKAKAQTFAIHAHRTSNDPGLINRSKIFIRFNQFISRKLADIRFTCGTDAAKFIYGTEKNSVTIPNGLDVAKCSCAWQINNQQKREELYCDAESTLMLCVGRLVTQKNQQFAIEVVKKLKDIKFKCKLYIVGVGDLENELRNLIHEYAMDDDVVLLGRRNDVYEIMRAADIMLLPSLYEGLPTVAVEAQAMGLKSLIADTITKECDLGMGLLDFLPIDSTDEWVQQVVQTAPSENKWEETLLKLEEASYTGRSSAMKYYSVLQHRKGN